jgi:hypothetical protein
MSSAQALTSQCCFAGSAAPFASVFIVVLRLHLYLKPARPPSAHAGFRLLVCLGEALVFVQ